MARSGICVPGRRAYVAIAVVAALFCSIGALAAGGEGTVTVTVPPGALELTRTDQGDEINLDGFGRLRVPGEPALPSRIFAIAIPPGATLVDVTFDMGRSNGDAAHTYQHLIDLANELYKCGAKGGILFYLPGWCGKYDAEYPDYTPEKWLGGERKFREMVNVLHRCGYRVQLHFLPWGADPFSPEFNSIKHLATRRAEEKTFRELVSDL